MATRVRSRAEGDQGRDFHMVGQTKQAFDPGRVESEPR